ncbi:MAG: globin domain-containing protein [Spongiibacteraceae bacterium]
MYDHQAYGVTASMYPAMFNCLEQVIAEVIGSSWAREMAAAWRTQFTALESFLQKIYKDDDIRASESN